MPVTEGGWRITPEDVQSWVLHDGREVLAQQAYAHAPSREFQDFLARTGAVSVGPQCPNSIQGDNGVISVICVLFDRIIKAVAPVGDPGGGPHG